MSGSKFAGSSLVKGYIENLLQNIITNHPNLKWKALNVRRHFGLGSDREGADETADE